jgi:hypothetical protein
MTSPERTGAARPAWIRERVRCHEEAWPHRALVAGLVAVICLMLALGALLWTATAAVYYAQP